MTINLSPRTILWIRLGLMALLFSASLVWFMLAFRSPSAQTITLPSYSMSILGAAQPTQAPTVAIPAAEHGRRAYEPNIELFRQEYFQLNHPEVLK